MATSNDKKSDLVEVGSFWKKESKDGKKFLSGEVKLNGVTYRALLFPNKKGKDTHPDYKLSLVDYSEVSNQTSKSVEDDDIPF